MITAFVQIWTEISAFLTGLFPSITELFYAEGNLTFVGVMAVIMAGVAMILLVLNLIRSFFAMRG